MRVVFPTFPDEVVEANYPFAPQVSRTNGAVTIDNDVFLDGRVFPPDGQADVYLAQVTVSSDIELVLANSVGEVARGSFPRGTPPDFLTFLRDEVIHVGVLQGHPAAGLQKLSSWPDGTYRFTPAQTQFAATVVVPQPQPCVRAIELAAGDLFTGDVVLVGERGIQVTSPVPTTGSSSSSSSAEDNTPDVIRVDVVGDPLAVRRACRESGTVLNVPLLRTIIFDGHEIAPSSTGGFLITLATSSADDKPALRITPEAAGLRLAFLTPNG